MAKRILRIGAAVLGLFIGAGIPAAVLRFFQVAGIYDVYARWPGWILLVVHVVFLLLGGAFFYIVSPPLINRFAILLRKVEKKFSDIPFPDFMIGLIGFVFGILIAYLLSGLYRDLPTFMFKLVPNVLSYVVLGYMGIRLSTRFSAEFNRFAWFRSLKTPAPQSRSRAALGGLVVDTSAIIDGRILDVFRAGFLPLPLIVPGFVLEELQHIADAADGIKRAKGRRGLDLLDQLREAVGEDWVVDQTDFPDVQAVDIKLVRLAQKRGCQLVTCDYNLNKVAQLSEVVVLNVNELAAAMRLVMTPGTEIVLQIVKEGNQPGQGVGYMPDGTMIVVDNARARIGETLETIVTSVLQTSAGRMIFARIKDEAPVVKADTPE